MAVNHPPYTEDPDFNAWSTQVTEEINNATSPGFASRRPAPAASSNDGAVGEIRFDADYIYVYVQPTSGNAVWKRIALTTF